MAEAVCRVCGWDDGDERWSVQGHPQNVICSACGSESGVEDLNLKSVRAARKKWLETGAVWFAPEDRPLTWSADAQLSQVPRAWR